MSLYERQLIKYIQLKPPNVIISVKTKIPNQMITITNNSYLVIISDCDHIKQLITFIIDYVKWLSLYMKDKEFQ